MVDTPASGENSSPCPPQGLVGLGEVVLNGRNQHLLEQAAAASGGDAAWRARKRAEARELLALSQIAPPGRLKVERLDMRESLRAMLLMRVPVPCRPGEDGELRVADRALIGLTYPQQVLRERLHGMSFIQVLRPLGIWHANCGSIGQPLCLGTDLPCGIPAKELVLMTYGALSMQTIQVDERDEAGIVNPAAARWWAANLHRIPLCSTPFLEAEVA